MNKKLYTIPPYGQVRDGSRTPERCILNAIKQNITVVFDSPWYKRIAQLVYIKKLPDNESFDYVIHFIAPETNTITRKLSDKDEFYILKGEKC